MILISISNWFHWGRPIMITEKEGVKKIKIIEVARVMCVCARLMSEILAFYIISGRTN